MSQQLRNLACKLWSGHEWGPWDSRRWESLLRDIGRWY
jgi:hypothetical protein